MRRKTFAQRARNKKWKFFILAFGTRSVGSSFIDRSSSQLSATACVRWPFCDHGARASTFANISHRYGARAIFISVNLVLDLTHPSDISSLSDFDKNLVFILRVEKKSTTCTHVTHVIYYIMSHWKFIFLNVF